MKKCLSIFVLSTIFTSSSLALSPEIQKQMYIGCYGNSKQYIGAKKAKEYCLCTIKLLGDKFSDKEINILFKQKPEKILKETEFAAKICEKR